MQKLTIIGEQEEELRCEGGSQTLQSDDELPEATGGSP